MAEYKHIKYVARLSEDRTRVSVKITEQTHRNEKFGDTKRQDGRFRCEEAGVTLYSWGFPDYIERHNPTFEEFFLRGDGRGRDDRQLHMSLEVYKRFKQAVLAYNKHFSGEADNV